MLITLHPSQLGSAANSHMCLHRSSGVSASMASALAWLLSTTVSTLSFQASFNFPN